MKKSFYLFVCLLAFCFHSVFPTQNDISAHNGRALAAKNTISSTLDGVKFKKIACGDHHALAIDENGYLWTWGNNGNGQLGDGTKKSRSTPMNIMKGHKFKEIAGAYNASGAIDVDGYAYRWGRKDSSSNILTPTLVSETNDYISLNGLSSEYEGECSGSVIFAKLGDTCGRFGIDKLVGNSVYLFIDANHIFRIEIGYDRIIRAGTNLYFKDVSGTLLSNDRGYPNGAELLGVTTDSKLITNFDFSGLSKKDSTSAFSTKIDYGDLLNKDVLDIAVQRTYHAQTDCAGFAITNDNDLYSFGTNTGSNLLGAESTKNTSEATTPVLVSDNLKFSQVEAGEDFALAIGKDGFLYSWGGNTYGQLGTGNYKTSYTPTLLSSLTKITHYNLVGVANEQIAFDASKEWASTYSVSLKPSHGTASIDNNGALTYNPNLNFYGYDYCELTLSYSGGSVVFPIEIYIDRKPIVVSGKSSIILECGQTETFSLVVNDLDNDEITYSLIQPPLKGAARVDSKTGLISYTASSDYAGGDSMIVGFSDGYVTEEYPIDIHIQSLITSDDDPNIEIDLNATNEYSGNTKAKDIDGDSLSYSVLLNGTKGNVVIDDSGNYTYKANEGAYGLDTFVIRINDGYKPLDLTYHVSLFSVQDGGTSLANVIPTGTVYNGQVKTIAKGATCSYSVHSLPSNGTVVIDSQTGDYIYTPNAGSSGDDSFVVLVDYGFGQYTITIHIYQNTAPDNTLVSTRFTTPENTNHNGTVQCTDIDGDSLTYSVKTQPQKGSLSLNANTGDYIYYPNENVAGDDSFEINVNDGTNVITILTDVHIESVISVSLEERKTISQNTSLSTNLKATDKDGDALTYTVEKTADNGIVNVDSLTGDYTYIPNNNYYGADSFKIKVDDGVSPKIVTIYVNVNRQPVANKLSINLTANGVTVTGTAACTDPDGDTLNYSLVAQPSQGNVIVNASNGGFAYTPKVGAHGNDSFQIRATDGCDDIVVTINVHNETAVELEEQESTVIVNQGKSTTGKVLAVDLDEDVLSYSILTYPTQGTVDLNASTGAWTYNATATAKGRDSFKVQVTDGNSTVSLEYTLIINTPALFGQDSYSFNTNQNTNYTGSVLATDADGDSLTYSVVSQGSKGTVTIDPLTGRYQYAPTEGQAGNDTFIIGVSDGNFTSEVSVNVHIESDISIASGTLTLSVAQNDIVTGNVNASDADGDILTYSILQQGDKGNANVMGDGSFSYYAKSGAGDDSFVIKITDGIHTSYVTVYVHISTNPYFEENSITISVPQAGSVQGQVHGVDPDGDTLSYSVYEKPSHGTINLNSTNGKYTYTAISNSNATTDSFILAVTDGNTTSYVTINVVINNAPIISDTSLTIAQGGSGNGKVIATDSENDTLSYDITSQGSYGKASINSSTGEYFYTVTDKSFSGTDYFTVSVTDGYSTKTIVLSVNIVKNQKPKTVGTTIYVDSGKSTAGQLTVTDTENDKLTYSISSQGDKGTAFIDENTGEFTYSAKPDTTGADCFVVTISDGYNSASYLVEVDINFVDSYNSWAIPTTIATGTVMVLSLGGLAVTLIMSKKKKVR